MALERAAIRSIDHFRSNRIAYPVTQIGRILVHPDRNRYTASRETTVAEDEQTHGVILVFRMVMANGALGTKNRFALYHRLPNAATAFLARLPGFHRKLWLSGDQQGDFLELHEWMSEADARRLIAVFEALLGPFDELGSATVEIVPYGSIDAFVDGTSYAWEPVPSDTEEASGIRHLAVVAGLPAAAYVAWRVLTRNLERRT